MKNLIFVRNVSLLPLFIDEDVQVKGVFTEPHELTQFLISNGFDPSEAAYLMNATLNVAHIFLGSSDLLLKPVVCDPIQLGAYVLTDEIDVVKKVSQALCSLSTDQVYDLANLVQENIDISGLIQRGENVANRTMSYNKKSLKNDVDLLVKAFRNMTIFQNGNVEVPTILENPELWTEEGADLIDSIFKDKAIDIAVLDTLSNLTLSQYLGPEAYENIAGSLTDQTSNLRGVLESITGAKSRKKREVKTKLAFISG